MRNLDEYNFGDYVKYVLSSIIAHKFEVRAEASQMLTGLIGGRYPVVSKIARAVADESSGEGVSDSDVKDLEHAIGRVRFP